MEFEGNGLGMVRNIRTRGHLGVAYVKERCDHYCEANMEMTYQIIDTGGLVPFADYRGFAKVIHAGPDACIVMLRSTFISVDMSEADAKKISEKNFEFFFQNIRNAVAAGEV